MSNSFPGDSPTPAGRPRKNGRFLPKAPNFVPLGSSLTRTERTRRLKDEMQFQLGMLATIRAKLQAELATSKEADISRDFIQRLKDVTACYSDLAGSEIRLAQAEKKLGDDLTPAEERDTALEYILSLEPSERTSAIQYLIEKSKAS